MNKIRVSSDKMYPYSAITPVPKGQVEFSKIQFYLSDDWNGRNIIAQFQQGEKTRNKALNSDNTCYIPSDFDIGLVTVYLKGYGLDGFSIATANGVSIPIVQGAFDGGDPAVPPEPDLYVKLIEEFQKGAIPPPAFAEVGQTIVVKAVDEEGKPTEWEAAHFLGGGGTTDHTKLNNRNANDQHPMSAITGLEDALAGKQPTGPYITEETDPTVPAWAKAETKPSYTAPEVGADPSGTAASQVSAHNTGTDTHSDIRLLIQGLTERLNTLADSDDTTLDQLSEIVAYIKGNRELIAAITTDKVGVGDIVNDLVTNVANKPLSAAQGVALKAMIDAITIPNELPNPNALTFTGAVSGSYDGSEAKTINIPSGGEKAWKRLRSFTLPEDPSTDTSGITWTMCVFDGYTDQIASFEFSTDENGDNFSVREVFIIANMAYGRTANYFGLADQNGALGYGNLFCNRNILGSKSTLTNMALYVRSIGEHVQGILTTEDNYTGAMAGQGPNKNSAGKDEDITTLKFGTFWDSSILPGSSFEFWGR